MVIFPLRQVKFMKPPPPIFSPIRFTLPLSAKSAYACLDELSRHLSKPSSTSHLACDDLAPLTAIIDRLEKYVTQTLQSSFAGLTNDKIVLDAVWARTTEVALKLHACTIGSAPIIDTLRTPTLHAYHADWHGSESDAAMLRAWLQRRLRVTSDTWQREREILEVDLEDTRDKSRLISAIRTLYKLDSRPNEQPQNANRLLCRLFPELDGAFTDCHFAVSGTLFFFALPDIFCDEEPMDTSHAGFTAFRARLKKFKQWQFSQFPMFGFLRGDEVDPSLIDQLADISGLAPSYIRRELGRVIGFLPLALVERYLVHDIWGHGWQASMLRLEGLYQQLADFDQNFDWNSVVVMPDRSKMRLSDCLQRTATGWKLHDVRFAEYMRLWIWNRIPTVMAPLVAELVADLFEHKLFWTDPALYPNLKTTSILPNVPAKLDLMLEDLRIYFKQIFKALDLFCHRTSYRQRVVAEMMTDGIKRDDAESIVNEIKAFIETWRANELASERIIFEDQGACVVNLFGYLEHHIALLGTSSSMVAGKVAATPTNQPGMRRWNDCFALLIAVYFEQDPAQHFWRLPEFVHGSMDIVLS
jgi:hypothetical protein